MVGTLMTFQKKGDYIDREREREREKQREREKGRGEHTQYNRS